jgi:hypothetical protein
MVMVELAWAEFEVHHALDITVVAINLGVVVI